MLSQDKVPAEREADRKGNRTRRTQKPSKRALSQSCGWHSSYLAHCYLSLPRKFAFAEQFSKLGFRLLQKNFISNWYQKSFKLEE